MSDSSRPLLPEAVEASVDRPSEVGSPQPLPRSEGNGLEPAPRSTIAPKLLAAVYLVCIIVFWAGAALWRLGAAPFYTKGEPREGLVVWEMTHGGGWILPLRNGTELPSKPPLFHWLAAFVSLAAGEVNETTLRLPSAVCSLAGVLAVFAAGSAWWSVHSGFAAALALSTSFEWARAATNARVDMVLTLGLEVAFLSLLAFWRNGRRFWLLLFYSGMAWATLGKGPVGIVLPALTAVAYFALEFRRDAWREGRYVQALPWDKLFSLRPFHGLLFVVMAAGSWYLLALWQGGFSFFRKQILAENLFTFLDNPDFGGGHRHGVLYLPAQLLLGFLPWSLLLPAVGTVFWRCRRELDRRDTRLSLLVWVLVVFSFYQLAASKRGVYLLALYPALALLVGYTWEQLARGTVLFPLYARFLSWVATLVAGICAAALLLFWWIQIGPGGDWLAKRIQDAIDPALSLAAIIGHTDRVEATLVLFFATGLFWLAGICFSRNRWHVALGATFLACWVLVVGARTVFLPAYAQEVTLRDFMREVRTRTAPVPVYFYQTFDYQAVYYSFGRIPVYEGALDEDSPQFLLVKGHSREILPEPLRQRYRPVAWRRIPDRGKPYLLLVERQPVD